MLEVADRIAVLRQGRVVRMAASAELTLSDIVGAMVGQGVKN
jgi:ABC-type sugar transport system ATPase subunit